MVSMAGKKKEEKQVVEVEYKIPMHCNACERTVAKAIYKIKGVEKFITDMANDRVVIEGKIDPEKVLKKLKKKTGKRIELVEEDKDDAGEEATAMEEENMKQNIETWLVQYFGDGEVHLMFNEENANACSIM